MKKLWLIVVAFIVTTGFVQAKNKEVIVSAENHKKCYQAITEFTIPKGAIATNFKLLHLDNGYNCHTNQKLKRDQAAFYIQNANNNRRVYAYYKYKKNNGLSNLVLGPGRYFLSADGGIDAVARLSYTLISK